MSQFDHGKHNTGRLVSDFGKKEDIPDGTVDEKGYVHSDRRLDPQRTPRTTARRQAAYDAEKLGNQGNGAFHRPGTQNKAK